MFCTFSCLQSISYFIVQNVPSGSYNFLLSMLEMPIFEQNIDLNYNSSRIMIIFCTSKSEVRSICRQFWSSITILFTCLRSYHILPGGGRLIVVGPEFFRMVKAGTTFFYCVIKRGPQTSKGTTFEGTC